MTYEDRQVLNDINVKLSKNGLESQLSYLYVSSFHIGIATEWGFHRQIRKEAAKAKALVTEELEKVSRLHS
jgi:hypothetical protein